MHSCINFGHILIFCMIFKFDWSKGVRILELKIPSLVDPRDQQLTLSCRFQMDGDDLNSVKWYKDEQEFFRYTPRQQPHVMAFPVVGVHLAQQAVYGHDCGLERCLVRLTKLSTAHSGGSYRCEVSTEAPTFRVAFDAANVTVAAVGKEAPKIEGIGSVYAPGDILQANCTASAADPPPNMSWLVNGQPAPALAVTQPRNTRPDSLGLVQRSIALRLHVERRHFREPDATLQLQCIATPPFGVPAPSQTATVTAISAIQARNVFGNQKLSQENSAQLSIITCWLSTFVGVLITRV